MVDNGISVSGIFRSEEVRTQSRTQSPGILRSEEARACALGLGLVVQTLCLEERVDLLQDWLGLYIDLCVCVCVCVCVEERVDLLQNWLGLYIYKCTHMYI